MSGGLQKDTNLIESNKIGPYASKSSKWLITADTNNNNLVFYCHLVVKKRGGGSVELKMEIPDYLASSCHSKGIILEQCRGLGEDSIHSYYSERGLYKSAGRRLKPAINQMLLVSLSATLEGKPTSFGECFLLGLCDTEKINTMIFKGTFSNIDILCLVGLHQNICLCMENREKDDKQSMLMCWPALLSVSKIILVNKILRLAHQFCNTPATVTRGWNGGILALTVYRTILTRGRFLCSVAWCKVCTVWGEADSSLLGVSNGPSSTRTQGRGSVPVVGLVQFRCTLMGERVWAERPVFHTTSPRAGWNRCRTHWIGWCNGSNVSPWFTQVFRWHFFMCISADNVGSGPLSDGSQITVLSFVLVSFEVWLQTELELYYNKHRDEAMRMAQGVLMKGIKQRQIKWFLIDKLASLSCINMTSSCLPNVSAWSTHTVPSSRPICNKIPLKKWTIETLKNQIKPLKTGLQKVCVHVISFLTCWVELT